jgi:hypothetical protein
MKWVEHHTWVTQRDLVSDVVRQYKPTKFRKVTKGLWTIEAGRIVFYRIDQHAYLYRYLRIEETDGPLQFDVPIEWLDETQPDGDLNVQWRERVIQEQLAGREQRPLREHERVRYV